MLPAVSKLVNTTDVHYLKFHLLQENTLYLVKYQSTTPVIVVLVVDEVEVRKGRGLEMKV